MDAAPGPRRNHQEKDDELIRSTLQTGSLEELDVQPAFELLAAG